MSRAPYATDSIINKAEEGTGFHWKTGRVRGPISPAPPQGVRCAVARHGVGSFHARVAPGMGATPGRARSRPAQSMTALLTCALLAGCAHLSELEQQEQRTLQDIRVAAYADVLGQVRKPTDGVLRSCLRYVHVLGDDPPTWEVLEEDPAAVARVAAAQAPVTLLRSCEEQSGPGAVSDLEAPAVRITIVRVDRLDPSLAVVRVDLWPGERRPPSGPSEIWTLRIARVAGGWDVTERRRTGPPQ